MSLVLYQSTDNRPDQPYAMTSWYVQRSCPIVEILVFSTLFCTQCAMKLETSHAFTVLRSAARPLEAMSTCLPASHLHSVVSVVHF